MCSSTSGAFLNNLAGYAFPNAMSISPYLEEPRVGPTSKFCSELGARLHCYVAAGYPERLPIREIETSAGAQDSETSKIGANSAVVYDPDGQWVGGYRKTNLFETDMTWAKAGICLYGSCLRESG